jgi:HEAT repeat protein
LNDKSPKVRDAAVNGLGLAKNNAAVRNLLNTVHNDPDLDVRARAIWALEKIGDATAIPSLIEFSIELLNNFRGRNGYTRSEFALIRAIYRALESIGTSETLITAKVLKSEFYWLDK